MRNRVRKDWQRLQPWRAFDTHHDLAAFSAFDTCQPTPEYTQFPDVCPSWDNSARRPPCQAIIFKNSSPKTFEDWLRAKTRAFTPPSKQENLVFINAWNEWAEGNHLEPCLTHGTAWLEAMQQVFAEPSQQQLSALSEMF